MKLKIIIYMLLPLYYCFTPPALADNKVLIILVSDNITDINIETVGNLYSFRQKFMPNNQKVKLTHLPMNSEDTIGFTQKVFDYYPYQLKRLWDQAIFSGTARSPKNFTTHKDLLTFIKNNNNAIGYLFINESDVAKIKEEYNVIATIN